MRNDHVRFRREQRIARRTALFLGILLSVAAAALAQDKSAIPDNASREKARQLVRQVFGPDYEKAETPSDKAAVARKMLDAAAKAKKDPASHFAILRVARDVAVEAGDAKTALAAVDEIAQTYQVDDGAARVETVLAAADNARFPDQRRALVEATLPLVEAALAEDDYETAKRLLDPKVLDLARRSRDSTLLKRTAAIRTEVMKSEKAYEEIKKARVVLETNPNDPEANLTVGRYLSLAKGDWEKGLAMLARGSDAQLKALALKEIAGVATADEKVALGDGWWELAQTEQGDAEDAMMLRAGAWYRTAQEEASALVKMKIDKRLIEIAALGTIELPKSFRKHVFTFDDEASMARYWEWDAEWTMGPDGATAPNGPKTFLRTRHAYGGDLTIDMDFSFGKARFSNTGGCWIALWNQELVISKKHPRVEANIHIHREGNEILFVFNGQEQRIPVDPDVAAKPTVIEIRWRSRTSHFRRIEIEAQTVVAAKN